MTPSKLDLSWITGDRRGLGRHESSPQICERGMQRGGLISSLRMGQEVPGLARKIYMKKTC